MIRDLRYALRLLIKSKAFTAAAVLSLGLGIGANTAIFSLIDAILLRMLPVAAPEQLYLLSKAGPDGVNPRFSHPSFERLSRVLPESSKLAAISTVARFNADIDGDPETVRGQLVSGEWFELLGVRPLVGRVIEAEDNRIPGSHPVAVLSHGYWQRRFASDPSVVGLAITVNGAPFTVIGISQPGFFGVSVGEAPDLWLPLMMQEQVRYAQNASIFDGDVRKGWAPQEGIEWLTLMLRVGEASAKPAVAEGLNIVFRQDLEERAGRMSDTLGRERLLAQKIELEPGGKGLESLRRRFSAPLGVLMGMVGLLLLVACANVANLSLARATGRRQEVAVRLAVGASRSRLVRQLLTESLLLAVLGGALGLLIAEWGSDLLLRMAAGGSSPIPLELKIDYRVLGFAAALSAVTALLSGLAPALRATRVELATALKDNPRAAGGARPALGRVLVVSQVALSLVLLAGAVLFARSLRNLTQVEAGFDRDQVLTVQLDLRASGYSEAQLPPLYARIIERVESVPGVRFASLSLYSLASGSARTSGIFVAGRTFQADQDNSAQENYTGSNYLATVGMRLLRGRDFGPQDTEKSPKVAIINETMGHRFFDDPYPIGRRFGHDKAPRDAEFEVVGVVNDARVNNLREPVRPMIYYPLVQNPGEFVRSLDVRTDGDPQLVAGQLRQALGEVDRNLPVREIITLAEQVDRTLSQEKLVARLTGFFSLLAVGLACLGLYGVMSYAVARRTNEIGIRVALGATRPVVMRMVLREALTLVLIGVAIGVPLALAVAPLAESLLFGLSPSDPQTLIAVSLGMLVVAGLAAYVPASRAAQVDPINALRTE